MPSKRSKRFSNTTRESLVNLAKRETSSSASVRNLLPKTKDWRSNRIDKWVTISTSTTSINRNWDLQTKISPLSLQGLPSLIFRLLLKGKRELRMDRTTTWWIWVPTTNTSLATSLVVSSISTRWSTMTVWMKRLRNYWLRTPFDFNNLRLNEF